MNTEIRLTMNQHGLMSQNTALKTSILAITKKYQRYFIKSGIILTNFAMAGHMM